MRSRVKDLHYEYCAVKPKPIFTLIDSELTNYPAEETEEAQAQINSINVYVNLVV